MSYTDTKVNLVINDLTQAQYNALQSVETDELYLTEDTSADKNLSNVTATGKILMAGMGMPSATSTTLTFGASGTTYTAPANGYFVFKRRQQQDQKRFALDGVLKAVAFSSTSSAATLWLYLPVLKGQTITLQYEGTGDNEEGYFYYAKGSESEAT